MDNGLLACDGEDCRRRSALSIKQLAFPDRGSQGDDSEQLVVFERGRQKRYNRCGKLADLAVLSLDYFTIPEEQIKEIESVLTIVGGKIVYAASEFGSFAPMEPAVSPAWSPVAKYRK